MNGRVSCVSSARNGFTIVELLVVIVVIGILAAITIVSYTGLTQKAVVSALQSDLSGSLKQLQLFQVENSVYPATIDCGQPDGPTNKCIKTNASITFDYKTNTANPSFFCLEANKNSVYYNVTQSGKVDPGPCPILNLDAGSTASYPGTGTVWRDLSGNDNDGTMTNGVSYDDVGGAMSFDGTDDYILIADSPSLSSSSLTLVIKLYIRDNPNCDTNNNWRSIIYKSVSASSASTGFDIVLEQDRRIAWDTGTGTSDRWWPTGLVLPMSTWTNLTVTYDESGSKKVYIDGVLHSTKSISALPMSSNNNSLRISNASVACPSGNGSFPGSISDVRIYNSALSDVEVSAVYEAIK